MATASHMDPTSEYDRLPCPRMMLREAFLKKTVLLLWIGCVGHRKLSIRPCSMVGAMITCVNNTANGSWRVRGAACFKTRTAL